MFQDIWVLRWILTHWGRVTHICIGNLTIIGSDNGLLPGRRQAITWTNVGILLIGPLGTNFSEMLIEIHTFAFKKIHLKMLSGKWRPFCLGLNVLIRFLYSNCPMEDPTPRPLSWKQCQYKKMHLFGLTVGVSVHFFYRTYRTVLISFIKKNMLKDICFDIAWCLHDWMNNRFG